MSEREILFRGKRVDNGEWIEGYFLPGNERKSLHPCIFVYLPETQSFECFDIDIDTLGEYTGLTDKNGTRIFEGDILAIDNSCLDFAYKLVYVIWSQGMWAIYPTTHDLRVQPITLALYYYNDDSRIVGNIHDNPELLKGD